MKKERIIILNSINVIFVTIATLMMFLGIHFMKSDFILEVSGISLLKFFTVESNILMGVTSLIIVLYSVKNKIIPTWLNRLNLISTTAVTLTLLTVVFYLAPVSKYGYFSLFQNSNLFYHLIIPILSIICFVINTNSKTIKTKDSFCGLIPTFLYSIYYIINALFHIKDGKVLAEADWYGFFSNGLFGSIITIIIMYLCSYAISKALIYLNYKYNKKNNIKV